MLYQELVEEASDLYSVLRREAQQRGDDPLRFVSQYAERIVFQCLHRQEAPNDAITTFLTKLDGLGVPRNEAFWILYITSTRDLSTVGWVLNEHAWGNR